MLLIVTGLKALFCKGFALLLILVSFGIKGWRLRFSTENWNRYFLTLSLSRVEMYAIVVYLLAAGCASFLCYKLMNWLAMPYPLETAVVLFVAGAVIAGYRYYKKGKEYITCKVQEVKLFLQQEQM